MSKTLFQDLLSTLKRSNKERKLVLANKAGYTTVEVANHFNISRKAIWKACKDYYKGATSQSFRWKFKE